MTAPPLTLGTAGHVDHGKTALVRALTGHDTDRLPEERARGLTIAPGFAPLDLPSGRRVSLVDVPGHERFLRHMIAGASGIDGWLLCVAADDGVMPQTREHADVLRLLGVERGVVAVTRADLADPAPAAAAARELVGPEHEVVAVSALTGSGLPELLLAIEGLAAGLPRRTAGGPARLFVDRAFTIPGAGTVVTGTLWGEPIPRGARVAVLPGGARARVREVRAHERPLERAEGGRVALNLAGLGPADAPRGSCVVLAEAAWQPSERLDVALSWLPSAPGPLRTRRRLEAALGTAETPAACVLLDADEVPPGGRAYAQLRLERPVAARRGDRLVLRGPARRAVAGAVVIDPAPARHGRGSGAAARLAALEAGDPVALAGLALAEAGDAGVLAGDAAFAEALAAAGAELLPGGVALPAGRARAAREAVRAAVPPDGATAGAAQAAAGLPPPAAAAVVAALVAEGALRREGGRLWPAGRAAAPATGAVAAALSRAGLRGAAPPALAEAAGADPREVAGALAALRREGDAVESQGLWFAAEALAEAGGRAAAALAGGPLTLGALRDLWGVGRRHAAAIAAHLDRAGVTARRGGVRVAGRAAGAGVRHRGGVAPDPD